MASNQTSYKISQPNMEKIDFILSWSQFRRHSNQKDAVWQDQQQSTLKLIRRNILIPSMKATPLMEKTTQNVSTCMRSICKNILEFLFNKRLNGVPYYTFGLRGAPQREILGVTLGPQWRQGQAGRPACQKFQRRKLVSSIWRYYW